MSMSIMRELEMDVTDRHLRELRQRLASINLRKVYNICQAVQELVAAAGGEAFLKKRFRSREVLDNALTNIDFDEIIAKARFHPDFNIPFGEVPHIEMNDPQYRGITVVDVVRGAVGNAIREGILKAVFPHAREKKMPAAAAVARKGNGV